MDFQYHKCFSIRSEDIYETDRLNDEVLVGIYWVRKDPFCVEGTTGEFVLDFSQGGIQMKVWDDAAKSLSQMPEVLELLDAFSNKPSSEVSVAAFCDKLKEHDYLDITTRDTMVCRYHSSDRKE